MPTRTQASSRRLSRPLKFERTVEGATTLQIRSSVPSHGATGCPYRRHYSVRVLLSDVYRRRNQSLAWGNLFLGREILVPLEV